MVHSSERNRDFAQVIERGKYLVPVAYDMPRDKGGLEAEFSKDGVSELFYSNCKWQPHPSFVEIDQTPGNRVMLLKRFRRGTTIALNIAEMVHYRPAIHLEAYAFAKANPELQLQFQIVALGSFVMGGDGRSVAVLRSSSGRRCLGSGWFDAEDSDIRFLFVRM